MSAPDDLAGRRFAAWTSLGADATCKRIVCRCRCGAVRQVAIEALQSGQSLSCGCSPLSLRQHRALRDEAEQRQRLAAVDWRSR
jgi:hypothetical protein